MFRVCFGRKTGFGRFGLNYLGTVDTVTKLADPPKDRFGAALI